MIKAQEYNNEIVIGCIEELPESDSLSFYRHINDNCFF